MIIIVLKIPKVNDMLILHKHLQLFKTIDAGKTLRNLIKVINKSYPNDNNLKYSHNNNNVNHKHSKHLNKLNWHSNDQANAKCNKHLINLKVNRMLEIQDLR